MCTFSAQFAPRPSITRAEESPVWIIKRAFVARRRRNIAKYCAKYWKILENIWQNQLGKRWRLFSGLIAHRSSAWAEKLKRIDLRSVMGNSVPETVSGLLATLLFGLVAF